MKNILVPTDFSECAGYAVEIALQLAQKSQSEIHFLHIIDVPADWISLEKKQGELYPEVTKKVNQVNQSLDDLIKKAEQAGLQARKHLVYNKNYDYVIKHVEDDNHDFIVMGSHGASGLREFFIGSNTQKIVRLSPVPVLVVKHPTELEDLKDIIFAADFDEEVMDQFKEIVNFAKLIGGKLHLVFINTPYNFTDSLSIKTKMGNYAMHSPALVVSTDVFNSHEVEDGLKTFFKHKGGDMLGMITHGRTGIARAFVGSITESVINHFDIPVLSFHVARKD